MTTKGTIYILCTQATKLPNGNPTGAWGEEIAAPYYVFKKSGYKTLIASPRGGEVPLAQVSLEGAALTPETSEWLKDTEAQDLLKNSVPIAQIDVDEAAAIFAAGGHGAAVDFPNSPPIAKLIADFYSKGKVVSSVCHGAEVFKNARGTDGNLIVIGKKLTGFSDHEETQSGDFQDTIEAPETTLRNAGATYSKASDAWASHVETDTSGTAPIVTGQNPASSEATALAVVKALA